ncbi:MAG: MFS transporter [Pseudomonadota bacterium]|nr:MFS transporter [Pseudomonadota bacterium]
MGVARTAPFGREIRAISMIGFGHFLSHFYMFGLVPLTVPIVTELQISAVELALIYGAFNVATALLQTPMGILVDRWGARKVLIGGLFVTSTAFTLCGLSSSYWELLVLYTIAGAGNSVFHPADFVILTSSVDESRHGKAYSVHSFGGALGLGAPLIIMTVLWGLADWRIAIIVTGAVGIFLSVIFVFSGETLREDRRKKPKDNEITPIRGILNRGVVLLFLFYVFTSSTNVGLTVFAPFYLPALYDLSVERANYILSFLVFSNAIGTLCGGWLADRTKRHDLVLVISFSIYAALLLIIGTAWIPVFILISAFILGGFLRGLVNPSRDIMVREIAPAGALGTVFAFVSTGFNIGQGAAPIAYGALVDAGLPNEVVYLSSAFMALSIVLLLFSRERRH